MKARRDDIATAILNILETTNDSKRAAMGIASYLVAEKRTGELDSLLRDLETKRFQRGGILEVYAKSVFPLTDDIKNQIAKLFDAENVVIHEAYDKKLLGGVKVRALDRVADFSVQARLQRLRAGRGL